MNKADKKRILLINDIPGYGTTALSAMIPVLNCMGYHICTLPTALVSNTLGYGKFEILETTHYMERTLDVWKELGFEFDAVSTGFFVSERQIRIIADFCEGQRKKHIPVFVDPIMGDDGQLYNGVSESMVASMRQMVYAADYIVPNYTEAAYLANMPYSPEGLSKKDAEKIICILAGMGKKSIVITSAIVERKSCTIVYNVENQAISYLPFERVPGSFVGSGDVFSAIFMGSVLRGRSVEDSVMLSMSMITQFMETTPNDTDQMAGFQIENCLCELQQKWQC